VVSERLWSLATISKGNLPVKVLDDWPTTEGQWHSPYHVLLATALRVATLCALASTVQLLHISTKHFGFKSCTHWAQWSGGGYRRITGCKFMAPPLRWHELLRTSMVTTFPACEDMLAAHLHDDPAEGLSIAIAPQLDVEKH
jgi:hypothetical protein